MEGKKNVADFEEEKGLIEPHAKMQRHAEFTRQNIKIEEIHRKGVIKN